VREFISAYTTLPTLRSCSTIYLTRQQTWNRCTHPLWDFCAEHRANVNLAELRELCRGYATKISMTLSLQSTPSTPLREAWDALDAVRTALVGDRWLRFRVDAWRWHVEITQGPSGWHPHLPFLIVTREPLSPPKITLLRKSLLARWAALADERGLYAAPRNQHFEPIRRTPGKALWYVGKGPMIGPDGSRTLRDVLYDAAVHHDAEAAADWLEVEEASLGRRWQGSGGEFRTRHRA
jgi:hypothetical protein